MIPFTYIHIQLTLLIYALAYLFTSGRVMLWQARFKGNRINTRGSDISVFKKSMEPYFTLEWHTQKDAITKN